MSKRVAFIYLLWLYFELKHVALMKLQCGTEICDAKEPSAYVRDGKFWPSEPLSDSRLCGSRTVLDPTLRKFRFYFYITQCKFKCVRCIKKLYISGLLQYSTSRHFAHAEFAKGSQVLFLHWIACATEDATCFFFAVCSRSDYFVISVSVLHRTCPTLLVLCQHSRSAVPTVSLFE